MCVHVDIYVYFLSIFLSLLRNIACYHISQSFLRLRTEGAPGRVPVGGRTKGEGEEEHEEEEEEQEQEQEQEEQEEAGHVLVFSLSLSLSFWCFHIIFLFVARCLWGFPSRASCLLSLILLERSGHHPPIFSFFLHLVFFSSFFCCVCVCVCVCSSCGVWRHRSPKDTLKINWPRYCLVWEIPLRYSLPFHQWDGRRDALPSFFFFLLGSSRVEQRLQQCHQTSTSDQVFTRFHWIYCVLLVVITWLIGDHHATWSLSAL